jgi:hypothetical protein
MSQGYTLRRNALEHWSGEEIVTGSDAIPRGVSRLGHSPAFVVLPQFPALFPSETVNRR